MGQYVIGMDGGGTKTDILALDFSGKILYRFQAGAINFNSEGPARTRETLTGILDRASKANGGLGGCAGVCIGAAGVSNPAACAALRDGAAVRYGGPLFLEGDQKAALYGAMGGFCGIIVISGTGSICYGKDPSGREYRTGGFGHRIDDEGSGYAVGRDILSAVVRSYDGRIGKTCLTELVFRRLHLSSVQELVSFVYDEKTGKREIAALAPLLDEAYCAGDPAAMQIAETAGRGLFRLLVPVAARLSFPSLRIALAGSILQKSAGIRQAFTDRTAAAYPGAQCFYPRYGAAFGAALIACEKLGRPVTIQQEEET